MATTNYAKALRIELTYEGGRVDDPQDPGGRTNQGVTQRVFAAFLRNQSRPARDVFTMSDAERDAIYRRQYADPILFDRLPDGIDLVVLDGAINSGVTQSVKWVQRAVGVCVDGHMGEGTLSAIESYGDNDRLIAAILAQRLAFLRALKTYRRFGGGWTRRVNNLQKIGQAWATGSVGPNPEPVAAYDGHRKAMLADAKAPPPRAPGDALAAGGTVTTGLTQAQALFQPMQGTPFADRMLVILTVLAALVGVAGFLWGIYARRQKAKLEDALLITANPRPADAQVANDNEANAAPEKDAA